ncbi:hypothetical protein J437_LFUL016611, partial [Ladona fulva]
MKIQINYHFEKYGLFSKVQYGFHTNKSTEIATEGNIISKILDSFEHNEITSLTQCDLSKAFDCVSHDILKQKLWFSRTGAKNCGILLNKSKAICQYPYRFNINEILDVKNGSLLGPLIFLILINDLPNNKTADTVLYANDTTFIQSCNSARKVLELSGTVQNQAEIDLFSKSFTFKFRKTKHLLPSLKDRYKDSASVKLLETKLSFEGFTLKTIFGNEDNLEVNYKIHSWYFKSTLSTIFDQSFSELKQRLPQALNPFSGGSPPPRHMKASIST